jgi:hypothetical protein
MDANCATVNERYWNLKNVIGFIPIHYEFLAPMASSMLPWHVQSRTIQKITMSKALSIALLVAGAVLLIYGLQSSDSVSSSVTRAVSGTPTDKTIWLIVLGGISLVAGGFGIFSSRAP